LNKYINSEQKKKKRKKKKENEKWRKKKNRKEKEKKVEWPNWAGPLAELPNPGTRRVRSAPLTGGV
jgi:hypothetical protein